MATTYNNLYLDTRQMLRRAGVEAAQLEARELICRVSGKSREQFWLDLPLYAPEEVRNRVQELLRRRLEGVPVAYLLGEWSFYGLDLDVTPQVLIPRADTEVLAEHAIARAREAGQGARALDLCAGTGCVGLAIAAHVRTCRVVLADLSPDAVALCRQNIRRCGLLPQVTCFSVDAREDPPAQLWDFDVIASNPPYIPTAEIETLDKSVRDYEPHLALDGGADGLDFYRAIIRRWKCALRPEGWLLFEVGYDQAGRVCALMEEESYRHVACHPDTRGILRVVEGQRPLSQGSAR